MKNLLLVFLLIVFPINVLAEEINITVKGMVCSFCAQGVKEGFDAFPQVESVEIDLESKNVKVKTKEGQTLTDSELHKAIEFAGYEVQDIKR